MTSTELAKWAVLGDPSANVPIPLQPLVDRVRHAIILGVKQELEVPSDTRRNVTTVAVSDPRLAHQHRIEAEYELL